MNGSKNVLGGALLACSYSPLTGFYRSGCCETGPDDLGRHIICVRVTESFLEFSRTVGNDLSTPRPEYSFAGLKPGHAGISRTARTAVAAARVCVLTADLHASGRLAGLRANKQ